MNRHKVKCDLLKKLRKDLSDTLGIDLHQTECAFEGECTGTCPKCRQEEDILNAALIKRASAIAIGATALLNLAACTPSEVNHPSKTNGGLVYHEEDFIVGESNSNIAGFRSQQ